MADRFSSTLAHRVKRSLSVFEKQSIIDTSGRALILPASAHTEAEELIEVGFAPHAITGVEIEQGKAVQLVDHYRDSVRIQCDDIFAFMAWSTSQYDYVHIDLCGLLSTEVIDGLTHLAGCITPTARVRLTVYDARRSATQHAMERELRDALIHRLTTIGAALDTQRTHDWLTWREQLLAVDDVSHLLVLLLVFVIEFGVDAREWVDDTTDGQLYVPVVKGRARVRRVSRWRYKEPHSPNWLASVWVDCEPREPDQSVGTILDGLHDVFSQIESVLPTYVDDQEHMS